MITTLSELERQQLIKKNLFENSIKWLKPEFETDDEVFPIHEESYQDEKASYSLKVYGEYRRLPFENHTTNCVTVLYQATLHKWKSPLTLMRFHIVCPKEEHQWKGLNLLLKNIYKKRQPTSKNASSFIRYLNYDHIKPLIGDWIVTYSMTEKEYFK